MISSRKLVGISSGRGALSCSGKLKGVPSGNIPRAEVICTFPRLNAFELTSRFLMVKRDFPIVVHDNDFAVENAEVEETFLLTK